MRQWSFVLLFVLAAPAAIACTEGSTIRARFYNCPVGEVVHVKIAEQLVTLKNTGDFYEGVLPAGQINSSWAIDIAGQPPVCCKSARAVPKARRSQDCAIEYAVYCDKRTPGWTVMARSDVPGVTFDFTPGHPDEFGKPACLPADFRRTATGATNLGDSDVVKVKVIRDGERLVTFDVTLAALVTGQLPVSRLELEKAIDDEAIASRYGSSGPARALIDHLKTLLPDSGVMVVKQ
jgi:hypothetical protein